MLLLYMVDQVLLENKQWHHNFSSNIKVPFFLLYQQVNKFWNKKEQL